MICWLMSTVRYKKLWDSLFILPYYKMHCFTHTWKVSSNNCPVSNEPIVHNPLFYKANRSLTKFIIFHPTSIVSCASLRPGSYVCAAFIFAFTESCQVSISLRVHVFIPVTITLAHTLAFSCLSCCDSIYTPPSLCWFFWFYTKAIIIRGKKSDIVWLPWNLYCYRVTSESKLGGTKTGTHGATARIDLK